MKQSIHATQTLHLQALKKPGNFCNHYFLSLLVLTGVTADELFDAYRKKDEVIHDRLNTGY